MATINLSAYNLKTIPNAKDIRFGIVVSQWNSDITENLFLGAKDTLITCGAVKTNIIRKNVPGSFELVFGAKKMVKSSNVDVVIVIGNIIQGETKHFDFVCQGVTQGIKDLNVLYDVPVIFCVLTDAIKQQSIDRSGGKFGNKGVEAAITAIKMAKF